MKKRKMLSLALALALIMSLVPVSGLAAEPSVLMDPGAVMQEDAEEAVSTEAADAENGEELFSPDADETEGQVSGEDPGETEELTGEPEGDQAFEEEPGPVDTGGDQTFEEEPAPEGSGGDQTFEEEPGPVDTGADQSFEEEPAPEGAEADQAFEGEPAAGEALEDLGEEPAAGDIFGEDEAAADEVLADETAADESAAEEAAASAEEETVDTPAMNEVEDGYSYVLMNIPYADFYAAELKAGSAAVDAVASATKSKPLNARLAGGSYHVNADGSDISGVIYPVKINGPEDLALLAERGAAVITDESSVEVSVPGRNGGDPTITVYSGKDALFQAPDYSYYDLGSDIQNYFKELTVAEDGTLSFSAVKGSTTRAEAEVSVTANASHTYYEMKVTSDLVQAGDTVSAVVLTAEDGTTYGLRHLANIWRGTEIGFEADETFTALIGKKITGLKYITQNGIYNFTVDALIPEKLPEYVLMNIPYADFYAAELAQGSTAVDAVASATMSKPRSALANGSYHVNTDGSDISGVVYPVKVGKGFQLDPAKQITDDASLSITVTLRGQEVTTEYHGRETLFEAPDYSWYALSAEEVPAYYKEARTNHGNTSFGPAVGEVTSAQADAVVTAKARHADYEIKLTPDEGVLDQAADVVSAVVLTDSEGNTYGLRHVANIWRVTEVGFNRDEPAGALAGKKLTNIRYYLKNRIVDLGIDLDIPVLTSAITLDKTSVSMLEGRTEILTASVEPSGSARALNWTTSDENVVTVDGIGIITAVAAGTATITAEAADNTGVSAVCQVTVTKPVSAITLDKNSASVLAGKTVAIKATVKPDDAGNKAVSWISSDKKVATVDAKGVVKCIAKGSVTITATAKDGSGVKAACKITVRQPVTKITLNKTSASILKGKTVTLKATAAPAAANVKSVTWTTSNKKVATVTANGVVKGIAKGTATITTTAKDGSGVKATCKVTVKQPVTKLTINKTKLTVKTGKTATLKVTVAPSNANDKSLKWTTSNSKIATVTQKGVVKGIKKGTVTITAAAKDGSGKKVTCTVTVQ